VSPGARAGTASRARLLSALVAVGALTALIAIGPISPIGPISQASAAPPTGVDQITGNGQTASAVTVSWSQGILGADNTTVVKPRDPSSPLAFMYDDFKNLKVTVGQTQDLVHQAVKVTWSGGTRTAGQFQGDFLQMMQCYGDAATGPDPQGCQYGSAGLLPSGVVNANIGARTGNICAPGSTPSATSPPGTADGSAANNGCDTVEPADPADLQPGGSPFSYSVPFVPVGTTDKIYGQVTQYYDQFNTNEVQEANTGADGTGQQFFQTLTSTEAPGLGCGDLESNGRPRDCWLVIVPRGEYMANGFKINPQETSSINFLNDSPLGASNWAQRIQVHLGFARTPTNCQIGSAQERQTIGTELVSRAVFSWQLALNAAANCKTIYGYEAVPEATDTAQLSSDRGVGLAFITIPIGSEAARLNGGAGHGTGPPVIYAPVAASAITLGFDINLSTGYIATPVKLTPRLLAKALTQSYKFDLADFDNSHSGPAWAKNNPTSILKDPEFNKLNPNVPTSTASGNPVAPLLTEDHSAINQQIWAWIQSDRAARSWLGGKPDENGMVVNPNYQALKLATPPAIDSYPRADPTCFDYGTSTGSPPKHEVKCALDLLPYVNNLDDGAVHVRAANNTEGATWDNLKLAPDGSAGWWGNGGVEPAGRVFMWAPTDSASLANYGLVPADLCDATGRHCVSADTSSVSTALATAKPDATGLLHVNPASPGNGGYPLVDVTYAAVRKDQAAAARNDYAALIDYAAGPGQTAGVDPGQLPHGYLPLPAALRNQAKAAAETLRAGTRPTSPATAGGTGSSGTQQAPPGSVQPAGKPPSGSPSSGGANPGGSSTPSGSPAPASARPSAANRPSPDVSGPAAAELAARATPRTPPGAVRWALLAVVLAGLAGVSHRPISKLISRLREMRR
jgi:hypothetical protein